MKVTAYWKCANPFHPDVSQLIYKKTIEVPDDMDLEELKGFAKADSRSGYMFDRLEKVNDSTPVSPLKEPDEKE